LNGQALHEAGEFAKQTMNICSWRVPLCPLGVYALQPKQMEVAMKSMLVHALSIGIALTPVGAFAHHGWSSYNAEKAITVTAPLTDVAWRNPHGAAKVNYAGKVWDVVLAPVARMESRGLTEAMLKQGNVTLYGYPRSDGVAEMRIERVTAQGKAVELR